MPEQMAFTRLYLPRLSATTVGVLLARLSSSDAPRPIVFELAADADGIIAMFGCAKTAVQRLKRLLRAVVPEVGFEAAKRPHVAAVSRVTARPSGFPLATLDPEEQVAALYDALAARRGDEVVAVQLILGMRHRPATVRSSTPDPLQPIPQRLLDGVRPAPTDVRRRLSEHSSQARFDTTLRIGVTADTAKRRRALTWEVFGTLQPMESPGVRLSLVRDTPARWLAGSTGPGWKLRLNASELTPLLGWPLGDRSYPGVPSAHPKLLPVPEIVSRTESVFATGTAPGPERPVGIDPLARLQHTVVLGPTGSGKSTLLEHLILSDITAGRACCVIEPKEQLVERILATARRTRPGGSWCSMPPTAKRPSGLTRWTSVTATLTSSSTASSPPSPPSSTTAGARVPSTSSKAHYSRSHGQGSDAAIRSRSSTYPASSPMTASDALS